MADTRRGIIRTLIETFREYRLQVVILTVLAILSSGLDALGINVVIPLVSFLLGAGSLPGNPVSKLLVAIFGVFGIPFVFRYLLIFIALIYFVRALVMALFNFIRAHINAEYMAGEIGVLFGATMRSSWPFMIGQKAGHVQSAIFWDVKRATQLLDTIVQFVQSCTGAIMYLVVAVTISPMITLVTLFVGGLILFGLRPLINKTRSFANLSSVTEKQLVQHLSEHVHGFKTVKASNATERVIRVGQAYIDQLRFASARTLFVQGIGGIFIQPLSFAFILAVFAFSYRSGNFNIAAFVATLYLIQKIFVYLESTQASVNSIAQFLPYADSINAYRKEVDDHVESLKQGDQPFRFEREIAFKDVSFSYPGRERVLQDISCVIPRGSMVALIGPSGSGKTSFVDLVLRLFKPSAGELLIDGKPAAAVKLTDWRRHIGYVSQDAFLLNASVYQNIRFYDDSITNEMIEEAARATQIYDDIAALPDKFETVLGDRGVTLSGGQRQRVALARALVRRPNILVLDEVTSALDSELESQIQKVIDSLRGSITLVVIAHRISTVLSADTILVIDKGRIIEQGTPSAMLDNPASYLTRMRNMQGGQLSA